MAYEDFTIEELKADFGLQFEESEDLFATVPPLAPSRLLQETLQENIPLALAISTEKARSELVISQVLVEIRRHFQRKISLFSGVEFSVAPERGLRGLCDFLLSGSPEQLTIEAPVVSVTEAKNESFKAGIPQCIATMIAARIFNQQKGRVDSPVFGIVTTGNLWKFLRLTDSIVDIDLVEYHIREIDRILGVIAFMFEPCNLVPG
jgi:hypothetical protein